MTVISELGRRGQEDHEFQDSSGQKRPGMGNKTNKQKTTQGIIDEMLNKYLSLNINFDILEGTIGYDYWSVLFSFM